ncbi:IclR family transcriptional regulator [Clostridiaceae bacterium UIB06]|uniref:IclR family transcriptional regulator n=1 Tax=Clostridium thailandense TaxID=2794346 RepID=A0A949TZX3_9CLOT|nr:IclR family transcriptional regulator [Clostridium thailandense]MBV7273674.1 IclR family transcriptional regulator [Clostridium thailandense]MCH5137066.1 IclR family transcriptional regulator [Clostridiaceae bacterium UIB06]
MDNDKYLLSSVYNTLEVVDLLSKGEEMSLAEISKELNMGKASIFRMLYTLEKKGFVYKTSDAKYKLGIKFAHYGSIVLERQNKYSTAKPFLQKLRDKHNETTHLAILDEDYNIIFMDKESSNSTIQMTSKIGAKLPAYCTGTGKVLLASILDEELEKKIREFKFEKKTECTITDSNELIEELRKTRAQGYGEDVEECEIGLVCYAAPIKDINGKTVAAISISGPTARMKQNKESLICSIKEISEELSKTMGYSI